MSELGLELLELRLDGGAPRDKHSQDRPNDERKERQDDTATSRPAWIRTGLFGALVGVLFLMSNAEVGSPKEQGGPFGQHYRGLQERRIAAGVPTMGDPHSGEHLHPQLALYAGGKEIAVPAPTSASTPTSPDSEVAGLHTHDEEGTIHVENGAGSNLGQFFEIWGGPLDQGRLGPYRANSESGVRMWVDGRPSGAFGALKLADSQEIVIAYSPHGAPPPPLH